MNKHFYEPKEIFADGKDAARSCMKTLEATDLFKDKEHVARRMTYTALVAHFRAKELREQINQEYRAFMENLKFHGHEAGQEARDLVEFKRILKQEYGIDLDSALLCHKL